MFHPKRGALRHGSPWLLRAPRALEHVARYYAAFLLAVWFLAPLLALALLLAGLLHARAA